MFLDLLAIHKPGWLSFRLWNERALISCYRIASSYFRHRSQ